MLQFLNRCSTAKFDQSFNNCARVHICGEPGEIVPPLVKPPPRTTPPASDGGVAPMQMENCHDPEKRPQVVYIAGSSNFIPLLQKLAPLLIDYTPVFQQTSSCAASRAMYDPDSPLRVMKNPTPGFFAQYFPASGTAPVPCLLPEEGVPMDIGESEIFASTCGVDLTLSPGTGESLGPMATIVFAVNSGSTQVAITAEAARQVFGIGGDLSNSAWPWQDPAFFFVRNLNTATQQMIGHAIEVGADQFWGADQGSAANVQKSLRVVPDANRESAIGLISTDFYEKDDLNLKALAFQAVGQKAAYKPDSSERVRDKRNVRDGHYPIWGPLHFFTPQSPSDAAKALLAVAAPVYPPKDVLDAYISSSLVPECAMMVERSSEEEILRPHSPPVPCGCYFDSKVPGGAVLPGCQACTLDADCPGSKRCIFGFCEQLR
jgi:hypothetical protein